MQFWSGLFAGAAASALFWLIDKLVVGLSQAYQIPGMVICFIAFGALGYWFTATPKAGTRKSGTRIASGLSGENVTVNLSDVTATGHGSAEILSDVDAQRDIKATMKNIKTKP